MSGKIIKGSEKISEAIRNRRKELGLTIEEAANKAGIGTKTWCRYEAGESIRKDKVRGVCKALKWNSLAGEEEETDTDSELEYYHNHEAWSEYICECYGEAAAISFIVGSDILLDYLNDDLQELSAMPAGTHVGQLDLSMLQPRLPEQFLMRYDYDFIYSLRNCLINWRKKVCNGTSLVAHRVIDELVLYLVIDEARFMMEVYEDKFKRCGIEDVDMWDEWIYDIFGDMDVETWLFSDFYVTEDNNYHFNKWMKEQFYVEQI